MRIKPSVSRKKTNSTTQTTVNESVAPVEKTTPVGPGRTIVSAVIDGSFSMTPMWKTTVKGYETFLDEQNKAKCEAVYCLRVFDTMQRIIYDFVPAQKATTIPNYIQPRGGTALNDAVCLQIERIDQYKMENPEFTKVVLLIMTDGEDNMSRRYDSAQLNEIVAGRVREGWQVTLMGTSIDAFQAGSKMGISDVIQYDKKSVTDAYKYAARSANLYRRTKRTVSSSVDLSEERDEKKANREENS